MKQHHKSKSLNIIAAEDDQVTATVIKKILEDRHCHVDLFSTGEDLLEHINADYDLVLLDLELPGMDGFQIVHSIRQKNADIANLPIVLLTAHQESEILKQARAAGINGFLTKPLSANKCNLLLAEFAGQEE